METMTTNMKPTIPSKLFIFIAPYNHAFILTQISFVHNLDLVWFSLLRIVCGGRHAQLTPEVHVEVLIQTGTGTSTGEVGHLCVTWQFCYSILLQSFYYFHTLNLKKGNVTLKEQHQATVYLSHWICFLTSIFTSI